MWHDETAEVWIKPLHDGRSAALLFNSGSRARDIELVFSRDLPERNREWSREVGPQPGDCVDKDKDMCPKWATDGQCKKNPGE